MRPASLKDVEQIVQTFAHDMTHGHFETRPEADLRAFVESCIREGRSGERGREVPTAVFVSEVNGSFVGAALVRDVYRSKTFGSHYPENTKELWMLTVKPEARGGGYGKRLAIELIQQYPDSHLIGLCKEASQKMIQILKNLGFVELGRLRGANKETLLFLDRGGAAGEVQKKMRSHHALE